MRFREYIKESIGLADMQTVLNDLTEKFEIGPNDAAITDDGIEVYKGPLDQIQKYVDSTYDEYSVEKTKKGLIMTRDRERREVA